MSRTIRTQIAAETVAICDRGQYVSRNGKEVNLKEIVSNAIAKTRLYSPESSPPKPASNNPSGKTAIEVTSETTFVALSRLSKKGGRLGCLNFASAKNPGGGFLTGAQAQEEARARSSALYLTLLSQPKYYDSNRSCHTALYLDLIIFSPEVPFFRDDAGNLLDQPVLASVITAPAPNAGAVRTNERHKANLIRPTLERRAKLVLQVAAAHLDHLVLGAWACGVFQNDPAEVANVFRDLLNEPFKNVFQTVCFAVFDASPDRRNTRAF